MNAILNIPDAPAETIDLGELRDPLADTIAQIRLLHREREDFHRAEKRIILQIKAICRRFCDGDKDAAKEQYKRLKVALRQHLKGQPPNLAGIDLHAFAYLKPFLVDAYPCIHARRLNAETTMQQLAEQLPIWPWVEAIRGLGSLGLAQLVGECGDLKNYDEPCKLWKRLGLAVFDGRAQRRCSDKAEALRQGFSPQRRAVIHNIGDSLFRAQRKENLRYVQVYDEYRARDEATNLGLRKCQYHKRALRYMEKRLVKELWQAWRAS